MSAESDLELRQQLLLMRSATLRATIAEQAVVLETPFALADRVHDAACWAWRRRVALISATVLALVVLRPRRVLRLAGFAWWAWRSKRRVASWLAATGLAGTRAGPVAAPHIGAVAASRPDAPAEGAGASGRRERQA